MDGEPDHEHTVSTAGIACYGSKHAQEGDADADADADVLPVLILMMEEAAFGSAFDVRFTLAHLGRQMLRCRWSLFACRGLRLRRDELMEVRDLWSFDDLKHSKGFYSFN